MSGYTSGNNAPTLMAQSPNRKGNQSKHTPGSGGVTAVTRSAGSTVYGSSHQGPAKTGGSVTAGRGQKVMVQCHCDYDGKAHNTGYMKNDSYNK